MRLFTANGIRIKAKNMFFFSFLAHPTMFFFVSLPLARVPTETLMTKKRGSAGVSQGTGRMQLANAKIMTFTLPFQ